MNEQTKNLDEKIMKELLEKKDYNGFLDNASYYNLEPKVVVKAIQKLMDKMQKVEWSIRCAESIYDCFEADFPEDDRPRRAIEAANDWLDNPYYEHDISEGDKKRSIVLSEAAIDSYEAETTALAASVAGSAARAAQAASVAGSAAQAASVAGSAARAAHAASLAGSAARAARAASVAGSAARAAHAAHAAHANDTNGLIDFVSWAVLDSMEYEPIKENSHQIRLGIGILAGDFWES